MPEASDLDTSPEESEELKIAQAVDLTGDNTEFLMREIREGEVIGVGCSVTKGPLLLKGDFSAFEQTLKNVTPGELQEKFAQVKQLKKELPEVDEPTRALVHACWRATRLAKHLLGGPTNAERRNISFDRFHTTTAQGKCCIKPLSACKGEAVCSEYAMFVLYILKKLQQDAGLIIGAYADSASDLQIAHTYNILNGGQLVFDPSPTAAQEECWPPKIYRAETPLTAESLRLPPGSAESRLIKCTNIITGGVRYYGSGA